MLRGATLLASMALAGATAAQDSLRLDSLHLAPGASAVIQLKENPSTGYVWRIDEAAGAGLDAVAIVDGGRRPGARLPGAPGTHRWTVRALKPGVVIIPFAYQRPWEPAPVETRRIRVVIAP
ncbi:protease inhibitor I42 family protein [Methylocystis echinoides]|uniref:protease inhibitor I42 family protein n=1 Tax=Methylocystis echinoides TaxID=29468 RepID=UPI003432C5E8